jgi:hypothetical protein
MLQTIEGRLDDLEMEAAVARMDAREEEPEENFVV